jgi:hypothetical protein
VRTQVTLVEFIADTDELWVRCGISRLPGEIGRLPGSPDDHIPTVVVARSGAWLYHPVRRELPEPP